LSIKTQVAANYFGQIYTAIMGFAFVPICIRYLGTEAYGLVAIFAILQSSAALLDLGMKPTLAREMARQKAGVRDAQSTRSLLRSAEIASSVIGTTVALAIWAASSWLATRWLHANRLPPVAIAHALTGMGLICALRFVENIYVGSIIGLQRQVAQCIVSCSMMTARAFGSVAALILIAPTIEVFFAWQVLISLVSVPIYAALVYRSVPPGPHTGGFSWGAVAGIWKFAGGVTANTLLTLLLTQLDKILLSTRLPLKVFAYYAVASVLSGALYMLSQPISAAFYPSFTQLIALGASDQLRQAYHQAAQLMAVVMGGAAVVLIVFADTALSAWTGDPAVTAHGAPLLRVLALGTLLNSFIGIPYQLQLASGWTSLAVKLNIASVSILAPALFVVIPRYGAIGAAWLWVALNTGNLVSYIYFMHLRLLPGEKWRWYRQDVAQPVLACGLTALACRIAIPAPGSVIGQIGLLLFVSPVVALAGTLGCQSLRIHLKPLANSALHGALASLRAATHPGSGYDGK
jgi:O-antigen/teichoic acid export membrane protein